MSGSRLGFSMVRLPRGDAGQFAQFVRFQCVECGATHDTHAPSDRKLNPEHVAKRAARDGWKVDAFRRSYCWCPKCAGPRKSAPSPEPMKAPIMTAVVSIREITSDQRLAIRALLDKHFDDKAGVYLDGQTDERIAEAVKVPRIHVERIREAAYGPIRVSAEYLEARAALDEAKRAVAAHAEAFKAVEAKMRAAEEKVEKLGKARAA